MNKLNNMLCRALHVCGCHLLKSLYLHKEPPMIKKLTTISLTLILASCGGSNDGDSKLITYNCPFEGEGIEGCWASTQCATSESGEVSTRMVFEVGEGNLQRTVAIYHNEGCNGQPDDFVDHVNESLSYEYDSTVTSSEGIETDLYQFIGYTLISIEDETMCFSEGVYEVSDAHHFTFFFKEEVSMDVNFENCVERI